MVYGVWWCGGRRCPRRGILRILIMPLYHFFLFFLLSTTHHCLAALEYGMTATEDPTIGRAVLGWLVGAATTT